jgi:hypothetical protein
MDRYSTHLNLMTKVFQYKNIETALEFGMGNFSTNFLIENTKSKVTSIEMQYEEWFNDIYSKFSINPKWNGILSLGPNDFQNLKYESKYDFVLVDGHGDTRPECVNFSSNFCDTIIAHDTEAEHVYGWSRVNLPNFYTLEDRNQEPWTKVWTKDEALIKFLSENL